MSDTLIPVPEGVRAFVVRGDPADCIIRDPDGSLDWSLWLVEAAMEDRLILSLRSVQRNIRDYNGWAVSTRFTQEMIEVHILSALHHPDSPLGLGYRLKQIPAHVDMDPRSMTVIWHGEFYTRDRRGVLSPLAGCDRALDWPTPEEWSRNRLAALAWAERKRSTT